ncbi:pyridoxamine 5'-phosphate oxidase family protein [Aeoliella sp. SH292]|jgi:general stress protein 26|uniref:pyridoxamine 5'-phosphate oxidase family protein n=1 Tax=Aeoliella sp. SH292 TaxID=3454464 RepID=UPI003F9AACCB
MSTASTKKKLDELYELLDDMDVALLTTRRPDGMLVTRPMATQDHGPVADLWFVTDINTHKVDEIEADPHVSVGYYNHSSKEWVSVSGTATVTQDRARIRELYAPDWKIWFADEGGNRDGGPDDPRLALLLVTANSVVYLKNDLSTPAVLFEMAKGYVTGKQPDIGRQEQLTPGELR